LNDKNTEFDINKMKNIAIVINSLGKLPLQAHAVQSWVRPSSLVSARSGVRLPRRHSSKPN